MPQSFHVYLIFLGQESVLSQGNGVIPLSCWKVELEKDVIKDGNLMVVGTAGFNNSFVESSQIAIGLRRVILRSCNTWSMMEHAQGERC